MVAEPKEFPKNVKELWQALNDEVIWLHGRWILYRQLYGTSPERIELLNQSAGTFFHIIDEVLMENVQLTLSNLTDKSHKNLNLGLLLKEIKKAGDASLANELEAKIKELESACEEIQRRRNKQIAHFDKQTLLASKVTALSGPSRREIENALEALRNAMNCVESFYANNTTAYHLFKMISDGDDLISLLEDGLEYHSLIREKSHDDFKYLA